MCGLTGWFSHAPVTDEALPRLRGMVDAIAHRGPDGRGECLLPHAALGHARLAIIDIDGGAQPMSSADGNCCIVYNGEIYNYPALRDALIRDGADLRTHSDTEVILELYRRYGTDAFARLRGMYAFALWDEQRRCGILARDPCGIKPLFIADLPDGGLSFGSEAKAILAGRAGISATLDEGSLHLLMNFRYLPGERSLFRGIRQLSPGDLLIWRLDGSPRHIRVPPPDAEDKPATVALAESVQLHFTADVEVGTYLSGGIDSALVTRFGHDHTGPSLRTFTLDTGDDPAEAQNAAETARLLGVGNALGHTAPEDMQTALTQLTWHLELPKINALQVSQVARHAAAHVKVVLSGLGGDELFYGYNAHRILWRAAATHSFIPAALTRPVGCGLASLWQGLTRTPWSEPERALHMLNALGDWPRVYGLLRNVWDQPRMREWIYGPRMLDQSLPNAFEVIRADWPEHPDPVAAMAAYEWRGKMVNDLLWQEDRASMAAGLEVRVPFVDAQLQATIWALGRGTLMPGGRPKAYLREQVSGILPAEVLGRPKSGFQVDAGTFFHQHLLPMAREWLSPERLRHYGMFNPGCVASLMKLPPRTGLRWHFFMLYLMLTTHLWLAIFEEQAWRPQG